MESSDLINEHIYNNYVWSAAHFEKKEILDSLIESKKHDIDLQVYFKCVLSHFDGENIDSTEKTFADKVVFHQSQPKTEEPTKKKKKVRRNSDDEPIDVDYESLNLDRAMKNIGDSYDPMT